MSFSQKKLLQLLHERLRCLVGDAGRLAPTPETKFIRVQLQVPGAKVFAEVAAQLNKAEYLDAIEEQAGDGGDDFGHVCNAGMSQGTLSWSAEGWIDLSV